MAKRARQVRSQWQARREGGFHVSRDDRLLAKALLNLFPTWDFDEAWYAREALVTNVLVEQGGKTMLTLTSRFGSRETRDAVLKSGMESGVAVSYDRLEQLLASQGTAGMEKGASPS